MLIYRELIELRNRLVNDEITLEYAKAKCWEGFKEGKRAWHTKDWKERRSEVILDKCQICSSKETLTLQHLSHPKKYIEHLKDVKNASAKEHIDSNPVLDRTEFWMYILENYNYQPVPMCPNCTRKNPNRRERKVPHYLCTECRNEFDDPNYKSLEEIFSSFFENEEASEVKDKCLVSNDRWKNKRNLSSAKMWFLKEQAKKINSDNIERMAFIHYLNDNIKYLSFEDTITACKKCASYFDLYKLDLCPKCRNYYKGVKYPTCIQCLPEEKRKIALEKIAFGRQMHEMHKIYGID